LVTSGLCCLECLRTQASSQGVDGELEVGWVPECGARRLLEPLGRAGESGAQLGATAEKSDPGELSPDLLRERDPTERSWEFKREVKLLGRLRRFNSAVQRTLIGEVHRGACSPAARVSAGSATAGVGRIASSEAASIRACSAVPPSKVR